MSNDIIQEEEIPIEEQDISIDESDEEQYIDELDRYQTDEDIEADVDEAMRILRKKD